jgi:hypothetical protein
VDKIEYWENRRPQNLKKKYGITDDDYDTLLASQGGRCAICSKTIGENGRLLAVDHNHITGMVRGLLCRACNLGIGQMEKLGFLDKALAYLGRA